MVVDPKALVKEVKETSLLSNIFFALPGTTHDYKEEWAADRYMIGDKMYAMLGGDKEGKAILTVKAEPSYAEQLCTGYDTIVPRLLYEHDALELCIQRCGFI